MINILMDRLMDEADIQIIADKFKNDINIIQFRLPDFPDKEVLDTIDVYFGWMKFDLRTIMPNLKWIHVYSAGVDNQVKILKTLESPPILSNNTGAYGIQLAEHSLAFVLALNKGLLQSVKHTQEKIWHIPGYHTRELYSSTVGIVGLGDVGLYCAKLFKAFGTTVYGHKLNPIQKPDDIDKIYYGNDGLDEMLPLCDYVIISLPGTEQTRNLFDRDRLNNMKKGSVITNVGRGYILDCDALADLLNSGHIAGAGLDVTNPEPLPIDHKLWDAKNIFITPHTAGPSTGKSKRARLIFEKNLSAFINGERMPTEIDLNKGY